MKKIEVLYPEICNLHGDLANIRYLKECIKASGEDVEIIETSLFDEPEFVKGKPDLIFIGTMSERSQEITMEKLSPYLEKLLEQIESGTLVYASGNALEIFGDHIKCEDGENIKCLQVFNTFAIRKMYNRFNSLYWGKYILDETAETVGNKQIEVVGFKSQFTHSYADGEVKYCKGKADVACGPLFQTERGPGLNPDVKGEGIRYKNFMGTYVLGPFMILNPYFTIELMKKMGVQNPKLAYEKAAVESYEVRLAEFKEPNRGYYY